MNSDYELPLWHELMETYLTVSLPSLTSPNEASALALESVGNFRIHPSNYSPKLW